MGDTEGRCSPEELLEILQWHILRCDQLRSAVANRAAVLLSANAFTAAGVVAMSFSSATPQSKLASACVFVAAASTLIFAALSVASATRSLINQSGWTAREGGDLTPFAPAFSHSDTVRRVTTLTDFRQTQLSLRRSDAIDHATSELWIVIRSHHRRYMHMQRSVRFFHGSLASFAVSSLLALLFRLAAA